MGLVDPDPVRKHLPLSRSAKALGVGSGRLLHHLEPVFKHLLGAPVGHRRRGQHPEAGMSVLVVVPVREDLVAAGPAGGAPPAGPATPRGYRRKKAAFFSVNDCHCSGSSSSS